MPRSEHRVGLSSTRPLPMDRGSRACVTAQAERCPFDRRSVTDVVPGLQQVVANVDAEVVRTNRRPEFAEGIPAGTSWPAPAARACPRSSARRWRRHRRMRCMAADRRSGSSGVRPLVQLRGDGEAAVGLVLREPPAHGYSCRCSPPACPGCRPSKIVLVRYQDDRLVRRFVECGAEETSIGVVAQIPLHRPRGAGVVGDRSCRARRSVSRDRMPISSTTRVTSGESARRSACRSACRPRCTSCGTGVDLSEQDDGDHADAGDAEMPPACPAASSREADKANRRQQWQVEQPGVVGDLRPQTTFAGTIRSVPMAPADAPGPEQEPGRAVTSGTRAPTARASRRGSSRRADGASIHSMPPPISDAASTIRGSAMWTVSQGIFSPAQEKIARFTTPSR